MYLRMFIASNHEETPKTFSIFSVYSVFTNIKIEYTYPLFNLLCYIFNEPNRFVF